MPYQELYNLRQRQDSPSLDLQWFYDHALNLGWVNSIKMVRTEALDASVLCGIMLRRDNPADHGLTSDYVIITSKDLDPLKEKIVAMKEIMQIYRPDVSERNATELGFDNFVRQFFGNSAMPHVNAVTSEFKALWMALGVVCPEHYRRRYIIELCEEDGRPLADIANEMEVSEFHASRMLTDQYSDEIQGLLT